MVDYQVMSIMLTGIGLIIALTYYALQIRNQNKTRQAQLLMQVYSRLDTTEKVRALQEVHLWEFNNINEYIEKYNNPEDYHKLGTLVLFFGGAGVLVRTGNLPIENVATLMGGLVVNMWKKFDPIKMDLRKLYGLPGWAYNWEYLYHKIIEYRAKNPVKWF